MFPFKFTQFTGPNSVLTYMFEQPRQNVVHVPSLEPWTPNDLYELQIFNSLSNPSFSVLFCQISLATELTGLKTKFTTMEAELTALQQRDEEMRIKHKKASSEAEKYRLELEHIRDTHVGQYLVLVEVN